MNYLLLIIVAGLGLASATPLQLKNELTFNIPTEWILVPDATGRLRMLHKSEIILSDATPFFNAANDVILHLYTRDNPTVAQTLSLGDSLSGTCFNRSAPTRFTIHGWQGTRDSDVNAYVAEAGLSLGHFNYITVDWSAGADTINFLDARNRIKDVGSVLAQFIDAAVRSDHISLNTLKIIGHSLGAHVAGMTAKAMTTGLPHSCIALDPAGPLFWDNEPDQRINPNDCEYVEVIHTNGGTLGYFNPIGKADFYPNGGKSQPGCGLDLVGTCSHGRANDLYAESFTTNVGFLATRCAGFHEIGGTCTSSEASVRMGGEPSNHGRANGIYYFSTASSAPFALGSLSCSSNFRKSNSNLMKMLLLLLFVRI